MLEAAGNQRIRMQISKLAALGLLAAVLSPTQPAQAVPYVYTDTVLGVSDLTACVENVRKVATKNGFTDNIHVMGSGESRDVYAHHASKPLALAVTCSTHLGAASIAIAGMNNDDTLEAFKKVYDDF
jgi:hypothetical protein